MFSSCSEQQPFVKKTQRTIEQPIVLGANRLESYLPMLQDKNIGIVANQTSLVLRSKIVSEKKYTHLIDSLLELNINIKKVFSPEHGFRGRVDAAEKVSNEIDQKTGLPIISLYGKKRKPSKEDLSDIDVMVFDIQDVGVRFYTYLSTLHYVMEACAENNIPLIVLDRPNPNAHYIDGPTLKPEFKSFLGMHPVPLVYGMTIGEYARMINGEKWLKNGLVCDLQVIPLKNYQHSTTYELPVRPSPNLPNSTSINLYPSLGLFEGTTINAGRGTDFQFQRYGAPWFPKTEFSYTPIPNFGSKYPKHQGVLCNGLDLSDHKKVNQINLDWLIDAYQKTPKEVNFFGNTFNKHAGNDLLMKQIKEKVSESEIREFWKSDLEEFKKVRKKYLLYH